MSQEHARVVRAAPESTGGPDAHEGTELGFEPPKFGLLPPIFMLVLAVAVLAGLYHLGNEPRVAAEHARARPSSAGSRRVPVAVQAAVAAPGVEELLLPASVNAFQLSPVHSRATGTIKRWQVDIGQDVSSGQLLAEIDAPDLVEDLRHARVLVAQEVARQNTAVTRLDLARLTLRRYTGVARTGGVSAQDISEKASALQTAVASVQEARAAVAAAESAVHRLVEQVSWLRITAPFAGKVVARAAEVGQMVNPASTTAAPLFEVAQVSPVRVQIRVPQAYVPSVRVGQVAALEVPEYPARRFTGTVSLASGALDPATRMMQVEVRIENADRALVPGMYGRVKLAVARSSPPVLVAAAALITDAGGTRVALVRGGRIHLQPVEVELDAGTRMAIRSGVAPGSLLVLNPADDLTEGQEVQVIPERSPATAPGH